jgi:hypothetical protein
LSCSASQSSTSPRSILPSPSAGTIDPGLAPAYLCQKRTSWRGRLACQQSPVALKHLDEIVGHRPHSGNIL